MKEVRVLESCLYAEDLEAAEQFYTGVLGLEVFARAQGRHVFFRLAKSMLLLFNPQRTNTEQTSVGGAPVPRHGARGPGHLAFAVPAEDLSSWRARFEQMGVEVESEVSWPSGGTSMYLRDPAGNSVELAPASIWKLPA